MNYKKREIINPYLYDTGIENIFINEYMPTAPEAYVKVYIFALMYATLGQDMPNEMIAKQLKLEVEDVMKAWTYWDKLQVVKKHYPNPKDRLHYEIEFLSLREMLFEAEHPQEQVALPEEVKDVIADEDIRAMFGAIEKITGKLLGGKEPMTIVSWINDFKVTPEIILYAYNYCVKTKNKDNAKYVEAVIREWIDKGLDTAEKVEEHLSVIDQRHYNYRRIFKAMGFNRNPGENERYIMDTWFDEMDFSMDTILKACAKTSGISNPNINYVNKILTEWFKDKGGTPAGEEKKPATYGTVMRYYTYLREKEDEEARARTEEVYTKVPIIKNLDDDIRKCGMQISKAMLNNQGASMKELKNKMDSLTMEKSVLLTENNFEINYMEVRYLCPLCNDTGVNDMGDRCECFSQRLSEAEQWQISSKK